MTEEQTKNISTEIEEKAVLCGYIETIAYSAVEKLNTIKNKYNKYIPKDRQECLNKNSINLENLIWTMQELSIQVNKGLLYIAAKI